MYAIIDLILLNADTYVSTIPIVVRYYISCLLVPQLVYYSIVFYMYYSIVFYRLAKTPIQAS